MHKKLSCFSILQNIPWNAQSNLDALFCFPASTCVASFASFFHWALLVILLSIIKAIFLPQVLPLKNIPSDLLYLAKVLLLASGSLLPKMLFANNVWENWWVGSAEQHEWHNLFLVIWSFFLFFSHSFASSYCCYCYFHLPSSDCTIFKDQK